MSSDEGCDRLTMALETEADGQFIGHKLKVGGSLQRYKIFKKLAGFRRPIRPVIATGKLRKELRTVLEPTGVQPVKVRTADLE